MSKEPYLLIDELAIFFNWNDGTPPESIAGYATSFPIEEHSLVLYLTPGIY